MLTTIVLVSMVLLPETTFQHVSCPLWLAGDSFQSTKSPAGWLAIMPGEARLSGGGLLHGKPDEQAYLRPDKTAEQKVGKEIEYKVSWTLQQPHMFETWMFCSYGGQATLQLFRKVDPQASKCMATSRLEGGAFVKVEFECR